MPNGSIPKDFIDSLARRAVASDIIGEHVKLKVSGNRAVGLCPFHNEKTPSFSVNNDLGIYKCFGCQASGDVYRFLMEHVGLTFVEAVERVANRYGQVVPRSGGEAPRPKHTELLELLDAAQLFFRKNLERAGPGDRVHDYLRERGIDPEVANNFGLGFAPPGWDSLKKALDGRGEDRLVEAGVLGRNESGKVYDRFRNRLMFPIRNIRGEIISFGGRSLEPEDKPKYMNGPDSPVFRKRHELYGLYEARRSGGKMEQVLLVEGYVDVLMLHQHGFPLVVAPLGTSATREQFEFLYRFTSDVVCCFDGDAAGRDAAWRALENALPVLNADKVLRFVFLPSGHDPDSLVRAEGASAIQKRIENSELSSDYFFRSMEESFDLGKPEFRAQMSRKGVRLLSRLPKGHFRNQMFARLQDMAGDLSLEEGLSAEAEAPWEDGEPLETRYGEHESSRPSQWRVLPRKSLDIRDRNIARHLLAHPKDVESVDPELIENIKRIAPDSMVCTMLTLIVDREVTDRFALLQWLLQHRESEAHEFAKQEHPRLSKNPEDRVADIVDALETFVTVMRRRLLIRRREQRTEGLDETEMDSLPPDVPNGEGPRA